MKARKKYAVPRVTKRNSDTENPIKQKIYFFLREHPRLLGLVCIVVVGVMVVTTVERCSSPIAKLIWSIPPTEYVTVERINAYYYSQKSLVEWFPDSPELPAPLDEFMSSGSGKLLMLVNKPLIELMVSNRSHERPIHIDKIIVRLDKGESWYTLNASMALGGAKTITVPVDTSMSIKGVLAEFPNFRKTNTSFVMNPGLSLQARRDFEKLSPFVMPREIWAELCLILEKGEYVHHPTTFPINKSNVRDYGDE